MVYRHSFRIPFQDIDAAGIVFFAHLFRYAHEAYEAFMRDIGQPLEELLAAGELALPLVHASADYRQPLMLGEALTMELQVVALEEKGFELGCCCRDEKGKARAVLRTRHVVQDRRRKGKTAMPAALRAALLPYCASSSSA